MTDTLTGIVPDLPEHLYHARRELSSTGARRLLESPAKFRYLQDHPEPTKDAYSLGTAVHTKVLGTGATVITYPDEHLTPSGAVSTKAATVAWADEKRAEGFVLIGSAQAAQVDGMTEAVLAHPTARHLFEQEGGIPEASVFATDPDTGVQMRARFDYLGPIAVDLKTTSKGADKRSFEKTVTNLQYEVQERWYTRANRLVTGEEVPFVFVVVEVEPPYLIGVHQLDVVFRDMGDTKAQRALEVYAACTESGEWPGHPTEVQLISPPTYAVYQHEEQYA